MHLHPRSTCLLPGWQDGTSPQGFGEGAAGLESSETREAALDRVRFWAEECDTLQVSPRSAWTEMSKLLRASGWALLPGNTWCMGQGSTSPSRAQWLRQGSCAVIPVKWHHLGGSGAAGAWEVEASPSRGGSVPHQELSLLALRWEQEWSPRCNE